MTQTTERDEWRYVRKFSWEFLRRNHRYQKDYKDLVHKLGTSPLEFDQENHSIWLALYVKSQKEVEKQYPKKSMSDVRKGFIELGRFRERWLVQKAVDPSQDEGPEFFLGSGVEAAREAAKPAVEIIQDPSDELKDGDELWLRINTSSSKKEILRQVDQMVEMHQSLLLERQPTPTQNPKWSHYQQILHVYDLVEKHQEDWPKVASVYFTEDSETPADDDPRKVSVLQEMFSEAKKMIELAPYFPFLGEPVKLD